MAFEIRAFKVEAAILDFRLKLSRKVGAEKSRYLENWYLEAGRDLGTSEADTEVGVL